MFIRKKELEEMKETIQRLDDRIETLEYNKLEDKNNIERLKRELEILKYPNGRIIKKSNYNCKEEICYIYNNKIYTLLRIDKNEKITVINNEITKGRSGLIFIKLQLQNDYCQLCSYNNITNYFIIERNGIVYKTNSNWQIQF